MSSGNGPRYAPEDPTLPKPWRGLIDGKTGYLYFWNPETNVTQYERPVVKSSSGLPPPARSSSASGNASAHAHRSSSEHVHRHDSRDDGRYNGSRSHHDQSSRGNSSHSQVLPNGSAATGYGTSHASDHVYNSHSAKPSLKHVAPNAGGGLTVESYRRQHEITVMGNDIPAPFMTFESTGFPSEILKEVRHAGFSAPTPIQAQSWPIALQNRDVVAVAKTGSGKTIGYLFPGFIHLNRLRNNSRMGPTVLVLAPTRELATQILDEAVKFGKSSSISCTCLYGGAPKNPQLRDIDRGVDIVVATPGRLNDILEMRRISLRQVSYLVLDEADRMLDMGFEPQIRKIVKEIPSRRQTLMFTATWPKEVRKIAADLLVNPVQVNIGAIDELVANKAITQYVEVITSIEKQRRVEQILRSQEPGSKILIFCSTKRMCDQLSRNLTRQFGAAAIHGDKSQSERDYVLSQFRTGRSPILVATDVAARGLDIKDIRVVINYDFPTGIEDYVHRIGRTGRAGATGVSYTFFSDQDAKHASDLIKVLEGACQRVPAELRDMAFSRGGGRGKFRRWGTGSGGREISRSYGGRSDSDYGRSSLGSQPSGRSDASRGAREQDYNDRYGSRSYHDSIMGSSKSQVDMKSSWGNHDTRSGERDTRRSPSRSRSPNVRQSHIVHDNSSGQIPSRSRSASRNCGGGTVKDCSPSRSRSRSHDNNARYGVSGSTQGWSRSPIAEPSSRYARNTSPISSPRHQHQQLESPVPYERQENNRKRSPSPYKKQDDEKERSAAPYGGQANHDAKRERSSSPYGRQDDHNGKRSAAPYGGQVNDDAKRERSSSPYGRQDDHDGKRSAAPYGGQANHDAKREMSSSPYGRQDDHDGKRKRSMSPYNPQEDRAKMQKRSSSPYDTQSNGRRQEQSPSPYERHEDHEGKRSPSPYKKQDHYGKQSPLPHERHEPVTSPNQGQNNSSIFHGNNLRERSPYSRSPSPKEDGDRASPFKEDNGWQQPHSVSRDGQLGLRSPGGSMDDGISERPMRPQPNSGDEEEGMIPGEEDGMVSSDAGWATRDQ